jgi:hypothetical protein
MTAEADAIRELNNAKAELMQAQNDIERLTQGASYTTDNPLPRTVIRVADAYVDLGRAAEKYGKRSREVAEIIRASVEQDSVAG